MNTYLWPFYPIGIGILFVLVLIAKNKRKEYILETQLSTKEEIIKNKTEGIQTLEKVMIQQGKEIERLKTLLHEALGGKPIPTKVTQQNLNIKGIQLNQEAMDLILEIIEKEIENN